MDYKKDHNSSRRSSKRVPPPVRRALREIGDDIATWRKLRGLTQAQLADRADVAPNTLRSLERGDGGASSENLLRILRGLGILENLSRALDPYESDVGRLRSGQRLPERVRSKATSAKGDG